MNKVFGLLFAFLLVLLSVPFVFAQSGPVHCEAVTTICHMDNFECLNDAMGTRVCCNPSTNWCGDLPPLGDPDDEEPGKVCQVTGGFLLRVIDHPTSAGQVIVNINGNPYFSSALNWIPSSESNSISKFATYLAENFPENNIVNVGSQLASDGVNYEIKFFENVPGSSPSIQILFWHFHFFQ